MDQCYRQLALSIAALAVMVGNDSLQAAEAVHGAIEKESAWVGQAVPLIVTLYSPGPFDGAPSFDLPELPQTAILKIGNAIVGSEEVDGESLLTQRHEFSVFTQRSGRVEIPPFLVRFRGKESFVGETVAIAGKTRQLQFDSKRPPGTASLGIVVTTPAMDVEQEWAPNQPGRMQAGDVIQRTVKRRVADTTAMMLAPLETVEIEGVRVYEVDPVVHDTIERGELSGMRMDTIKYQFQRAGTYQIPEVTFSWWDPTQEKVLQTLLPGLSVQVDELQDRSDVPAKKELAAEHSRWGAAGWIGCAAIALTLYFVVRPLMIAWYARRNSPAQVAQRRMLAACRIDDAQAAYSACLAWMRIAGENERDCSFERQLGEPWKQLRVHLYSEESVGSWDGRALQRAFLVAKSNAGGSKTQRYSSALPPLNP